MVRQKDPAQIRVDAVHVGAKKLVEGCPACAEGYFRLARQHGATDADIAQAIENAQQHADRWEMSRRSFLKAVALNAAAAALVTSGIGHQPSAHAAAPADPALAIAWLWGLRPFSTEGEYRAIGYDTKGAVVGEIDALAAIPFLSPDGRYLCTVSARVDAGILQSELVLYDTATGVALSPLYGENSPFLGDPRYEYDSLRPIGSDDGRYLAVLRQSNRLDATTVQEVMDKTPSELDDPTVIIGTHALKVGTLTPTYSVELFDLASLSSVSAISIGTGNTVGLNGTLCFNPKSEELYCFSQSGEDTELVTLAVDGTGLRVISRTVGDQDQHKLPPVATLSTRSEFLADEQTLVRYDGGTLCWFDVLSGILLEELSLDFDASARPYQPVALFSPDRQSLYVINSGARSVRVVDLIARKVSTTLALAVGNALVGLAAVGQEPRWGAGPHTATLSPDGQLLYMVDDSAGAGILIVQTSDWQVVSRVLTDRAIRKVWATPDGQAVFALGRGDGLIYILDRSGNLTSAAAIEKEFTNFVSAVSN